MHSTLGLTSRLLYRVGGDDAAVLSGTSVSSNVEGNGEVAAELMVVNVMERNSGPNRGSGDQLLILIGALIA